MHKLASLLLSALAATLFIGPALAVSEDVCERQRADYPKAWNEVGDAKTLYRCQSHYEGAMIVTLSAPDDTGRSLMGLFPVAGGDQTQVSVDGENPAYRIWLDAKQAARLKEGSYFASVVRKEDSCWIRGDLSEDPVFFMDNEEVPSDSPDAGAFYNKAPRVSAFKGAAFTCEPVK